MVVGEEGEGFIEEEAEVCPGGARGAISPPPPRKWFVP